MTRTPNGAIARRYSGWFAHPPAEPRGSDSTPGFFPAESAAFHCMLVGSMAGSHWGIPLSTHDLDFVLKLQPADVDRLAAGFRERFTLQGTAHPARYSGMILSL